MAPLAPPIIQIGELGLPPERLLTPLPAFCSISDEALRLWPGFLTLPVPPVPRSTMKAERKVLEPAPAPALGSWRVLPVRCVLPLPLVRAAAKATGAAAKVFLTAGPAVAKGLVRSMGGGLCMAP